MKKAQGLPIYAIVIIILAIVILAIALLYIFGVVGKGKAASEIFFNLGSNITENASAEAQAYVPH